MHVLGQTAWEPGGSGAVGEPIVLVRPTYPLTGGLTAQPRAALALMALLALPGLIVPLWWGLQWAVVYYVGVVAVELLAVAASRRARRRACLAVFHDRVLQVGWNGRGVQVSRALVARIVRVSLAAHSLLPDRMRVRGELLLLIDAYGQCALRVRPAYFAPGDIERVLAAVAVSIEDETGTLATSNAIARRFPGALPWWLAHLALVITVVTASITALAVVIAVLAGLAARPHH